MPTIKLIKTQNNLYMAKLITASVINYLTIQQGKDFQILKGKKDYMVNYCQNNFGQCKFI